VYPINASDPIVLLSELALQDDIWDKLMVKESGITQPRTARSSVSGLLFGPCTTIIIFHATATNNLSLIDFRVGFSVDTAGLDYVSTDITISLRTSTVTC
jgi:hypothetical protein